MAVRAAQDILEQDFLTVRCLILDLASALDRIERGENSSQLKSHEQLKLIRGGLDILQENGPGRAEKVQLHFSDKYQEGWNK
jgi:hypothetical protein